MKDKILLIVLTIVIVLLIVVIFNSKKEMFSRWWWKQTVPELGDSLRWDNSLYNAPYRYIHSPYIRQYQNGIAFEVHDSA